MLPENKLQFSDYSSLYDLIIPKDNLLRRINDIVDFSFVREELVTKYCQDNGRMAQDPVRMFKYLLLKTIYDMSDESVVERSRYDMSFKYFLGMMPEDEVINASSLCKFRKLRLKDTDLLKMLIGKTVEIAIEKEIIKSKTLIVDATHTASRSNPVEASDLLKFRAKQLVKSVCDHDENLEQTLPSKDTCIDLPSTIGYTEELVTAIENNEILSSIPNIKERLEVAKETLEDIKENKSLVKDKDARIGHKTADTSFLGYKTHIGITDERLIVSAVVTSGEKGDGPVLPEILEQAESNGVKVETIIGDAAYSGRDNLILANKKEIELVAKLNPVISNGNRGENEKFDYNKDAGMFVCPAGHMAVTKRIQKRSGERKRKNDRYVYYFDIQKCKVCPQRDGCYQEGAKKKGYSVTILAPEFRSQIEFEQSERFRIKSKERYKVEAKNAELKHVFGYDRAESYGIDSMRMQGAMAIFAANLKRILKITESSSK